MGRRVATGRNRALPCLALGLASAALVLAASPSPAPADIAIGGPPPEVLSGAALFNAASRDGRRVVFSSRRRLARGDRDRVLDVYLREAGATRLLSPGGGAAEVRFVAATPDARAVLFLTAARLSAADGDAAHDLYRQGRAGLELISVGPPSAEGAGEELRSAFLSADGRRVVFASEERLLAEDSDDARDVYEHHEGRLRLVSAGTAAAVRLHAAAADASRVVVSTSAALDPGDVDGFTDIYTYGPEGAVLISAGGPTSCPAFSASAQCKVEFAAASADAGRVYFETVDSLSPLDSDAATDVYLGSADGPRLVSTGPGDSGSASAALGAISADGRRAFFVLRGRLAPLAGDAFCALYERRGERTALVSTLRGKPLAIRGCEADEIAVSADGGAVVFSHGGGASRDSSGDLYRRRRGHTTTLVSAPRPSRTGLGGFLKHVSADGSRIAFMTWRPLVPADRDGGYDLYSSGPRGFTLLTLGPAGGNGPHIGPPGSLTGDVLPQFGGASADGRRVFFATDERLVRRDRNEEADLYERGPSGLRLLSTRGRGGR